MKTLHQIRIAAAVPVVRVADPATNAWRIIALMEQAAQSGAQIVVTPELSVTGASCGDLFGQRPLQKAALAALKQIVDATKVLNVTAVVGMPLAINRQLCDVAVVAADGRVARIVPKSELSSRERRWFSGADVCEVLLDDSVVEISSAPIAVDDAVLTLAVGNDVWSAERAESSEGVIINPFAEPATMGGYARRKERLMNMGGSCMSVGAGFGESSTDVAWSGDVLAVVNGEVVAEGRRFSTEGTLTVVDMAVVKDVRPGEEVATNGESNLLEPYPFIPKCVAESWEAFAIQRAGLMQRLASCGIGKCVIGISGGLDSTLALLVTVAAYDGLNLCRRDIVGITMPGFGTTSRTHTNAVALMRALGITIDEISIREACLQHFSDIGLPESDRSATYENAQARERTQILMDYAGRIGGIVVGTGDLSELALG